MTRRDDPPAGTARNGLKPALWRRIFAKFPITGQNMLGIATPETHAQDSSQPASSSNRNDARSEERHWHLLRGLLPFIWPDDRPDLRRRVVLAAIILVLAKVITVLVPVFFKEATDTLTAATTNRNAAILAGVAMWASAMVVGYGVGRIAMMVLTQVRDVLFTAVGQNAVRALNNRTFRHLHQLSLRFHLERRTGGVSRVIERATGRSS